jgi:glucose-1-phosphate cytidylyltransferase
MKVVLFCGGMGTRLREYSDNIPKPLVPIGTRPILWHVMRYYAHFGHKDFILCLGYKAEKIKEYFLNYNEYVSNDFVLSNGGHDLRLLKSDTQDWRITFIDTGMTSNIGKRLKLVEEHLKGEEFFLANYSDGLTDLPLNEMIDSFKKSGKIGCFLCVKPSQTFHVINLNDDDSTVEKIEYVRDSGIFVNGGYFVFRKDIFENLKMGEELVEQPFQRLMKNKMLIGYKYKNFWAMDTFKEQQELTDLYQEGKAAWEVWKNPTKT